MKLQGSSRDYTKRGLTLIEVVAATALLGTLLAGCLVGFRSHRQQLQLAAAKLQAVESLDLLMADFFQSPQKYSLARTGHMLDGSQHVWVMSENNVTVRSANLELANLHFEVFDPTNWESALASVELVVPVKAISPPKTSVQGNGE